MGSYILKEEDIGWYVVDIDGTICTPGPTEEMRYEQAMPIQSRIDKINKLYDEGHIIVYLTARGMGRYNIVDLATKEFYEFTEIQLSLWGCKYHQLFLGKPAGDYYIDDKGINDNDFFDTTSRSSDPTGFVPKGWGFEKWIANSEKYCGKLLFIAKGKQCSWHYHRQKDEVFFIQSGGCQTLLWLGR